MENLKMSTCITEEDCKDYIPTKISRIEEKSSIIDLRSDTLTKPTEAMRLSMAEAAVGDDVYGEDPTVNKLQEIAAKIFGKEDALFVPSGTMGNLISVLSHCWERGSEVLLGDRSHIYCCEQGGLSQFGGIIPRPLQNLPDGTFNVAELRSRIQKKSDPHFTRTDLIAIENTIFGKVLPLSFISEVRKIADEFDLPVHLDGARVFHAASALGVPVSEISQYVDSASVCLSKGLGAPVGTVIVGSKDFIQRAVRLRKALGGSMRQAGILAAPGIIALTKMSKRLHEDHKKAKLFAKAILDIGPDLFTVDMENIQTNMVVFDVTSKWALVSQNGNTAAQEFQRLMEEPTIECPVSVKLIAFSSSLVRIVFYHEITVEDTQMAIAKLLSVSRLCKKMLASLP